MNDELSAWERSREATRRIMADAGCDEKGYPLPKDSLERFIAEDVLGMRLISDE